VAKLGWHHAVDRWEDEVGSRPSWSSVPLGTLLPAPGGSSSLPLRME
jgi:hypothetical protein